jgi:hypothetical protein
MSPAPCACLLCEMESRLLADLRIADECVREFFLSSQRLRTFDSAVDLLSHLRSSPVNSDSDDIFRDLLNVPANRWFLVETLLLLTFLPVIHQTIRCIGKNHPTLSREDITQESLILFLQFLRSTELHKRTSHFAFAISRAAKRQLFVWAAKESKHQSIHRNGSEKVFSTLAAEDSCERLIWLRHFLQQCLTRELLSFNEMDLLIQFKLEENYGDDESASSTRKSSNAVRQRLKRLLAKLRRVASA